MAQLKEHITNADTIEKIVIDDADTNIVIAPSQDDRIYIRYVQKAGTSYQITEEDGALRIQKDKKWYAVLSAATLRTNQLMVFLPEKEYQMLQAKTTNGDIHADGVFVRENVKLLTGNGEISATLIKAGEDIVLKSRNGKIEMSSLSAESRIVAKTSNDAISFEGCDAGRLFQCHTTNGNVTGRMPESMEHYAIYSQTTNGHNNLPTEQEGPEKTIDIETGNGDIKVTF